MKNKLTLVIQAYQDYIIEADTKDEAESRAIEKFKLDNPNVQLDEYETFAKFSDDKGVHHCNELKELYSSLLKEQQND